MTSASVHADCVVLVDSQDSEVGVAEKLDAHRRGLLHRAFSVLIFNNKGEVLLQRRARSKYHSPGLWSNSCCGHPRPGESITAAAARRVNEELGIQCALTEIFTFTYSAPVGNDLCEHEIDHVFVGLSESEPGLEPSEVEEWAWGARSAVTAALLQYPEQYTVWFPLLWERAVSQARDMLEGRDQFPTPGNS